MKLAPDSGTEPRLLDVEAGRITSASQHAVPSVMQINSPQPQRRLSGLTLIALKSEAIYAVTDYWLDNGRLDYVLSNGTNQSLDIGEIDWGKTMGFNAERGVIITLRNNRHPDQ